MRRSACSVNRHIADSASRTHCYVTLAFPADAQKTCQALACRTLVRRSCDKDSVCHLETRPSQMAREAIPQHTKSQQAGPHLTTNTGSPNRSNTGDQINAVPESCPLRSCRLRKCHEIYGSLHTELTAAIPTHVLDLPLPRNSLLAWGCIPLRSHSKKLRLIDFVLQAGPMRRWPEATRIDLTSLDLNQSHLSGCAG